MWSLGTTKILSNRSKSQLRSGLRPEMSRFSDSTISSFYGRDWNSYVLLVLTDCFAANFYILNHINKTFWWNFSWGTGKWVGIDGVTASKPDQAKMHQNELLELILTIERTLVSPPIFYAVGAKMEFWSIVTLWFWYKTSSEPIAVVPGPSKRSNKFVSARLAKIPHPDQNTIGILLVSPARLESFARGADTNLLEHPDRSKTAAISLFSD